MNGGEYSLVRRLFMATTKRGKEDEIATCACLPYLIQIPALARRAPLDKLPSFPRRELVCTAIHHLYLSNVVVSAKQHAAPEVQSKSMSRLSIRNANLRCAFWRPQRRASRAPNERQMRCQSPNRVSAARHMHGYSVSCTSAMLTSSRRAAVGQPNAQLAEAPS